MQDAAGAETGLSSENKYRLLVEAISDYAIYMLDENGRVSSWNPGAQRFKGYEEAEIIGQHFSRFYAEEDRETGLPARALSLAAEEGRFEGEGWRLRRDGTRFWAHVVIKPIRDISGRLSGFAKVTRDLTERKLAEEALQRSEHQFRILVQGVTDYAIYMLDSDGLVASWNLGAQRIKGYAPEEIIGESFARFYPEEERERGAPGEALQTARNTGRFEKEGWRVRKDGSHFWAHVVIDAIRDEGGTVIGFAKVTRDITERREAQLALETAREQLLQSQKMEAVGQLTGGVAHDFNNLLMAILSSLDLMKRRLPPDERLARLHENATQAAERGASLTRRMLTFARRQNLEPKAVALPELVNGMAEMLARSLGPEITIETRFPPVLAPALTDPNYLESGLLNLALNARDAMPEGGAIVISGREETITGSRPRLKPGHYVCLSVADTGEGMAPETLGRAAEPFFTTKEVGKGTGLGLSMVHGLAEQSGGELVLHSALGQGTRAEIWLPAAPVNRPLPPGEHPATTNSAAFRPLRVLAVDDDALVLMNTAAMLEDLGHVAREARSGTEALAVLSEGIPIDLVITDHAMPGMTGSALAQAIRAQWPDLPVVLATGYADLPEGGDIGLPRLSKPYLQTELARVLAAATAARAS